MTLCPLIGHRYNAPRHLVGRRIDGNRPFAFVQHCAVAASSLGVPGPLVFL